MSEMPTINGMVIDTTAEIHEFESKTGDGLTPPPKINKFIGEVITVYGGEKKTISKDGKQFDGMTVKIQPENFDNIIDVVTYSKYVIAAVEKMPLPFRARLIEENNAIFFRTR